MFTQEVYEALSEGISSHPVKDFFDDIPAELSAPFHGPELEERVYNVGLITFIIQSMKVGMFFYAKS